jgi:hypothetical protein
MATSAQTSPRSGSNPALILLHQTVSVVAAAGLVYFIWFWQPNLAKPETVEAAAKHMFMVGLIALAYLAFQSLGTLSYTRQSGWRLLFEFSLSMLPLLVLVYAGIDWARGSLKLNPFQMMTMTLIGFAVLIDVVIYSLVSQRIVRRAAD